MENKTQKQPNDGEKEQKTNKFDYDIFVSYRQLSNDKNTHSASLARSITQTFRLEGFKVFFYCNNTKDAFEIIKNNKSHYYIILATRYSIDAIENHSYKSIEDKENNDENIEDDGYNFAKELYLIDKGIESCIIDKKNVFLFNIDKCFEHRGDIPKVFSKYGYKFLGSEKPQRTEVINFPTNEDFSIDKLINPDPDKEGEIKIKKSPRFSYDGYKELYENNKRLKRLFQVISGILIVVLVSLIGINLKQQQAFKTKLEDKETELKVKDSMIYQYKNECIIFAGGGTVQKYLSIYHSIDVNNYEIYPSKYIHLPSKEAWSLIWDDFTESGDRHYWPVVLSAEKLEDSIRSKQKQLNKEVVGYEIGDVSLKVQIINNKSKTDSSFRWQKTPSLYDLCNLLKDTNYIVHTTSEHSGTYNAYKKLLQDTCLYDLDSRIKEQKGRKDFTPDYYDQEEGKNHIFLANSLYHFTHYEEITDSCSIFHTNTQKKVTIPLFVYTIANKKTIENNTECVLCPQVKEFLYIIGCDTSTKINDHQNIKITMLKSR